MDQTTNELARTWFISFQTTYCSCSSCSSVHHVCVCVCVFFISHFLLVSISKYDFFFSYFLFALEMKHSDSNATRCKSLECIHILCIDISARKHHFKIKSKNSRKNKHQERVNFLRIMKSWNSFVSFWHRGKGLSHFCWTISWIFIGFLCSAPNNINTMQWRNRNITFYLAVMLTRLYRLSL